MEDKHVLILFLLGIFLVFTFSGVITGESITFKGVSKSVNNDVLNMFENKCEVYLSKVGSTCAQTCSEVNRKCTFGLNVQQFIDMSSGEPISSFNPGPLSLIPCNKVFFKGAPNEKMQQCMCCSA